MIGAPIFEGGEEHPELPRERRRVGKKERSGGTSRRLIQAFQEVSSSLAALDTLASSEIAADRSVKRFEKSVQISNDR